MTINENAMPGDRQPDDRVFCRRDSIARLCRNVYADLVWFVVE